MLNISYMVQSKRDEQPHHHVKGASKLTISYRVASKLTVENHRNMLPALIHEAAQKCIVNSYSGHGKDEGKAVLPRSTSLSA